MWRIGSLFSGIGGLDLGLERAGLGRVAWCAEVDPYCQAVLRARWPEAQIFDDARDARGEVDVICGGFPCQPVSTAGQRRAQADERWLWPVMRDVIERCRPSVVVAENVLGLRTAGLRDVLADLAEIGFDAEWTTLSAGELGAPHRRQRIFIVATHPDRLDIRVQPGWLSRACRAAAALASEHGVAWASPNAHGLRDPDGCAGWGEFQAREPEAPERGESSGLADPNSEGQPQQGGPFGALGGWARDSN